MRSFRFLFATALLTGACASAQRQPAAGSPEAAPVAPTRAASTPTLVATLLPTNASGNRVSGRIRLVAAGAPNQYRAEIDLRGGAYQSKFPWVIRAGQCEDRTHELGNPTDYRLIETAGDGMARFRPSV